MQIHIFSFRRTLEHSACWGPGRGGQQSYCLYYFITLTSCPLHSKDFRNIQRTEKNKICWSSVRTVTNRFLIKEFSFPRSSVSLRKMVHFENHRWFPYHWRGDHVILRETRTGEGGRVPLSEQGGRKRLVGAPGHVFTAFSQWLASSHREIIQKQHWKDLGWWRGAEIASLLHKHTDLRVSAW